MKTREDLFQSKKWVFPNVSDGVAISKGLTKRELFAAMAMQGMLANGLVRNAAHVNAIYAVQHADALINELNKE